MQASTTSTWCSSTTARRGGRSRSTTRSASSTISAKKGSCASLACRGSCRTCPNRSRWGSSTRSDPVLGTRSRARGAVHCRFGGGSRDDHPWRSGARCRRPGRLRVRSVPRGPSARVRAAPRRVRPGKPQRLLDGMAPMAFLLRFTLSHPAMDTTIVGTSRLKSTSCAVKCGLIVGGGVQHSGTRDDAQH